MNRLLIATTLFKARSEALEWIALNHTGAKLSKAVMEAGPSCANVSGMFVRAPENELNHGADLTLAFQEIEDQFSDAYTRAFDHRFFFEFVERRSYDGFGAVNASVRMAAQAMQGKSSR